MVESEGQVVVGVNKFAVQVEAADLERLIVDPTIEAGQRERLAELRSRRDGERVSAALSRIEHTAKTSENLVPLFIEAVENDVTLGEICGVLRQEWGEYRPVFRI
jgi:methylmalonyl-CoA mutase N-terminal domain/subunit